MSEAGLYSRILSWDSYFSAASDVFVADPSMFSALLEDPAEDGAQILVSRSGKKIHFEAEDLSKPEKKEEFFSRWKKILHPVADISDPSAIRCLVYAAYEAGCLIENLPKPKSRLAGPVLWLHFPEWSCRYLPEKEEIHINLFSAAAEAEPKLDFIEARLREKSLLAPAKKPSVGKIKATEPAAYKSAVLNAKKYIRAGDIFQANIARFWSVEADESIGPALYASLRKVNPAPFSAYMDIESKYGRIQIISASPERLFHLSTDGVVNTRPIAGTRKRGVGRRDEELGSELLLSEKERAEHTMLVDLERNDLGRVCQPGTVEVNESMSIERYATVQHIVSNVRGVLSEKTDVVDVFRAMFPGGTITGCPKVRCMQLIHELEGQARGPYTGSAGYINWDGSADMNILIRTFWLYQGRLHWAAGAGIVADSSPEFELREAGYKADGLLRALELQ